MRNTLGDLLSMPLQKLLASGESWLTVFKGLERMLVTLLAASETVSRLVMGNVSMYKR
jgi:hypothetical protein